MAADVDRQSQQATLRLLKTFVDEAVAEGHDWSAVELVTAMERVSTIAQAVEAMAIVDMTDEAERCAGSVSSDGRLVPDPEFVPDEVALGLHCSPANAHRRCQLAKDAARHPALSAVTAGQKVTDSSRNSRSVLRNIARDRDQ
jgi:hypothetical protein